MSTYTFVSGQLSKRNQSLETEKMDLISSKDVLNKELKTLKDEINENVAKLEILKKGHHEDVQELKDRYDMTTYSLASIR